LAKLDTAIIILNYKNYVDTINCINSILNSNNSNYIIIVVDNDSRNNSLKHIEESFSNIVPIQYFNGQINSNTVILLVENSINSGYASGNNIGLRIGHDLGVQYLLVLNNDTIFTNDCLDELKKNMDDSSLCVGPLLLKENGSIDYNCAKRRPKYSDFFVLSYFGRYLKTKKWQKSYYYLKENPLLKETREVDIISGSCMLFDSLKLKEIDFFDENTFLYFEEAIISEKARLKNYTIKLVPSTTVIHLGARTTKKQVLSYFILRCEYNSAVYYLTRWRNLSLFNARLVCFSMYLFLNMYTFKNKIFKRL
jgi:GT2 family glycosyltransferase